MTNPRQATVSEIMAEEADALLQDVSVDVQTALLKCYSDIKTAIKRLDADTTFDNEVLDVHEALDGLEATMQDFAINIPKGE